jgi:hypothetical protein
MPLIIVEGVDGSGKSTFTQSLSLLTPDGTRNMHCGPIRKHPLEEYVIPLVRYRPREDWVICDRWQVGEMVYGPLYRGESKISPAVNAYIELFLRGKGAYRLIMGTPFNVVQQRLQKRGEDFLKPQHVRVVMDFYDEYRDTYGWDRVPFGYNPTKYPPGVILNAQMLAESAFNRLQLNPTYVGYSSPDILFVMPDEIANGPAGLPTDYSTGAYTALAYHRLITEYSQRIGIVKSNTSLDTIVMSAKHVVCIGGKAWDAVRHLVSGSTVAGRPTIQQNPNAAAWADELVKAVVTNAQL